MPGSVGEFSITVKHTESTSSDRSDVSSDSRASGKKVSFNKAVRIKKYPLQMDNYTDINTNDLGSERKFRFKVSKNRRNGNRKKEQDYSLKKQDGRWQGNRKSKLMPIVELTNATPQISQEGKFSTVTTTGSEGGGGGERKQMETSRVKKNYVKEIVNKFNKEATLRRERKDGSLVRAVVEKIRYKYSQPSEPPIDYNDDDDDEEYTTEKQKKNMAVNGVKVMFDTVPDCNGGNSDISNHKENMKDQCDYQNQFSYSNLKSRNDFKSSHSLESIDEYVNSEEDDSLVVVLLNSELNCETLDKRNELTFDHTNSATQYAGDNCQALVRRQQIWHHDRGHQNFENTPNKPGRRRVRSYESILGDKSINERIKNGLDKGVGTEVLDQTSHERSRTLRGQRLDGMIDKKAQRYTRDIGVQCNTQSFKDQSLQIVKQQSQIINPTKTYDPIFSILEEEERESPRNQPLIEDVQVSSRTEKAKKNEHKKTSGLTVSNGTLRHVKTKNRSFGFKLSTGFLVKKDCVASEDKDVSPSGREWYDESIDIHLKNQKIYQDIFTEKNDSSLIQEVDSRKYQNPLSNGRKKVQSVVEASNLWRQAVDEDCLEIRSLRNESMSKRKALPRPKLCSNNHENPEGSHHKTPEEGVLMNTKDAEECAITGEINPHFKSSLEFRENKAPQSELSCVRGGLAAAYKTRQKVAQERRPSSFRNDNLTASGLSSSDSDTTRCGKKTSNNEAHLLKRRVDRSSKRGPNQIIQPHSNDSVKSCQKNSPITPNRHLQLENSPRDHSVSHCSQEKTIPCENGPFIEHRSVSNEAIVSTNYISDWNDTSPSPQNSARIKKKDESGDEGNGDTGNLLKPICKEKSLTYEDSLAQSALKRRHSVPKNAKLAWLKLKLKSKPPK